MSGTQTRLLVHGCIQRHDLLAEVAMLVYGQARHGYNTLSLVSPVVW